MSSTEADPVVAAVLLPHAPILVPPVGGPRGRRAQATIQAMREASSAVVGCHPDALVLISPHMPRHHDAFGLAGRDRVRGDLAAFDCPGAAVDLPSAPALGQRVQSLGSRAGLHFHDTSHAPLDHGATVPLWFLAEAGWKGPTLVLGLGQATGHQTGTLGNTLRKAAHELGLRIAVVASGDMSHRLTPDAPCGHHPRAAESDAAFIRLLRAGRHEEIGRMDPDLLELAAEDATETTRIAVAATNGDTTGHRVLSYEGPFGVGYGVALLCHHPASRSLGAELLQIARMSLESAVRGIPHPPPDPQSGPLTARHGVFVTLHRDTGELRGCIGTLAPHYAHVAEETWLMAREAALSDSRFAPVEPRELDHLVIDVSVLSAPEPVDSEADLDPARYGVIVRAPDGRCGTLLPDIPGIDSPREQVAVARRKAGIRPDEDVRRALFHREVHGKVSPMITASSAHPARWWAKLPDGRIECRLCPRFCRLNEGQRGFCFVRQRLDDRIVLTTYGRSSGFCIDPIEKKPLNHFLPGTAVLSFGTAGCNLGCRFCQNWSISKAREFDRLADRAEPSQIAAAATRFGCRSVAFTYNDPVIFAEYAIDTARACREAGIRSVAVTAGYINPEARAEFYQHIDAANVDLKGFTEEFYHRQCYGQLAPVLDTLRYLHHETSVWLEVTTLLIPGLNDSDEELDRMTDWFIGNLGPVVPWHFTAFHPDYKMMDRPPTPHATLRRAREMALRKGCRYVYVGNVHDPDAGSTWCPRCHGRLIERDGYILGEWNLQDGKCRFCGLPIPGVFEPNPGSWSAQRIPVRLTR